MPKPAKKTTKVTTRVSPSTKKTKAVPKTRASRAARTIKVKSRENPRRPGTAAYKYHEAMSKSKTVGDYLGRYKDPKAKRDASLWLSTSVRDGHVAVA